MSSGRSSSRRQGILHALLPGARVDRNTNKILVNIGTNNDTVTFNVGGTIFETYKSTLRSIPNSQLANEDFLAKHFRPQHNDHFFDRDPNIFECILNYLRTGELHLPTSVCGPVVKSELEFWGIDEVEIEECCWTRYSSWTTTLQFYPRFVGRFLTFPNVGYKRTSQALRQLEKDRRKNFQLNSYPEVQRASYLKQRCADAWVFFVNPSSSIPAQVYAYCSLTIILASIFSFCAQTHTTFQLAPDEDQRVKSSLPPVPLMSSPSSTRTDEKQTQLHTTVHPAMFYLEIACFIYFVIELLLRFNVCPSKTKFIFNTLTAVELLALLPDLVDFIALLVSSKAGYERLTDFVGFLRLLRVFRIFRLMRHIPGLWILVYTLKASVKDLLLLLLFLLVGMLVFSSLVFYAEFHDNPEDFSSIPKCFWWAVITMTTVGYGDMYPRTGWGYLIGTATGISGVLLIGFTIPVLVNNFILYYQHSQSTFSRENRRNLSMRATRDGVQSSPTSLSRAKSRKKGDEVQQFEFGGLQVSPGKYDGESNDNVDNLTQDYAKPESETNELSISVINDLRMDGGNDAIETTLL